MLETSCLLRIELESAETFAPIFDAKAPNFPLALTVLRDLYYD
jgi:hypothetical protein